LSSILFSNPTKADRLQIPHLLLQNQVPVQLKKQNSANRFSKRNFIGNSSFQLVELLSRSFIFRSNNIGNRFSLRKINSSIDKSTKGKFFAILARF
jgi:hypothetical protein